jgi:phosphotransferase system enzyme I (PtsI)
VSSVVEAAHAHGIEVSICGEMCGEPIYTVLLLGLGLRSFSVSPISIPMVKGLIRKLSMGDAEEIARACLACESAEECQVILENRVKHLLPEFC